MWGSKELLQAATACLLLTSLSIAHAAEKDRALIRRISGASSQEPGVMKQTYEVVLNRHASRLLRLQQRVKLHIGTKRISFRATRKEKMPGIGTVLSGDFGASSGHALFVFQQKVLVAGSFRFTPGGAYRLIVGSSGRHHLERAPKNTAPLDGVDHVSSGGGGAPIERQLSIKQADANAPTYLPDGRALVDVGVMRTQGVSEGIWPYVELAFAEANEAFRRSGVTNVFFSPIRMGVLSNPAEDPTDAFPTALAMADPNNARFAEVRAAQNSYGADIMMLITSQSIGYAGAEAHTVFTTNGVTSRLVAIVVGSQHVGSNLVVAHELGHASGFEHNPEHATTSTPQFPSAYGWHNGVYKDIMSSHVSAGVEIPYFSNPQITYNGTVIGQAGYKDAASQGRAFAPILSGIRAHIGALPSTSLTSSITYGPPIILDNCDSATFSAPGWSAASGAAFTSYFNANTAYCDGREGKGPARFSTTAVSAGRSYRVAVAYTTDTNRATDVTYSLSSGGTGLKTTVVNQRLAPTGLFAYGSGWQVLGVVTPQQNEMTISVSGTGNGAIIADAVLIQEIGVHPDFGRLAGGIFAFSSNRHACLLSQWNHYLLVGGPPDLNKVASFSAFPAGITYDGLCHLPQGPYMDGPVGLYANGQGYSCWLISVQHWLANYLPALRPEQFLKTPPNDQIVGPCAVSQRRIYNSTGRYFSNGVNAYCKVMREETWTAMGSALQDTPALLEAWPSSMANHGACG